MRRMFSIPVACLATLLTAAPAALVGQASGRGSYDGQTYTNSRFRIAFTLPAALHPVPLAASPPAGRDSPDASLLAIARQGTQPYGMILLAQHLSARPGGIHSSLDFLGRVRRSRARNDVVGTDQHREAAAGLSFDWLEWQQPDGEWDAAVLTRRGDYLIVARCNAANEAQLASMRDALLAMRTLP